MLLEEQAGRTPESPAVVFRDKVLTYREIDLAAAHLARRLRAKGVGPGTPVGLCLKRSPDLVIGILGILKAGGAYVPIDPTWPRERIGLVLEDLDAPVILTQERLLDRFLQGLSGMLLVEPPGAAAISEAGTEEITRVRSGPDASHKDHRAAEHEERGRSMEAHRLEPENLAYLIYTSGSSGRPKAVAVTHGNLLHSTLARAAFYRSPIRSFLLVPSFAFDSSVAGIFWTLSWGGTLVLPEEDFLEDLPALGRLIARHRVSHWLSVPSLYEALLAHAEVEDLESLDTVIVAGEACPPHLPERHHTLLPHARLFNEYGPTEAAVWSTVFETTASGTAGRVRIGRPIPGTRIYVLDRHGSPVPVGVPGEIAIGGAGVAAGYRRLPDLTARRFVPDPFADDPGARLYLTGDSGRWLPDGNLDFLGRLDQQLKIRGFRIEPQEIEAVLAAHPAVAEAAIVPRGDATTGASLAAYVVPHSGEQPKDSELKRFLGDRLPAPMVPGLIRILSALPRTSSGKLDRRVLRAWPIPEREGVTPAPSDDVERRLVTIWQNLLGQETVGVDDDFFALGGHSLLAVRLVARIEKEFGTRLSLSELFQDATLSGLAGRVRSFSPEGAVDSKRSAVGARPQEAEPPASREPVLAPAVVCLQPLGTEPPFIFVHPLGGMVFCYAPLARRLGRRRPFLALQSPGLESGDGVIKSIEEMADRYLASVRRIRPIGPYLLGGWSFGGVIAYEMACRLARDGQSLPLVTLIDSHATHPRNAGRAWDHRDLLELINEEAGANHAESVHSALPGIQQVVRSNLEALWSYSPGAYPGRVHLLRAAGAGSASDDPTLGWGAHCSHGVDVHDLQADHFTILREPAVDVVAEKLKAWSEAALHPTAHSKPGKHRTGRQGSASNSCDSTNPGSR